MGDMALQDRLTAEVDRLAGPHGMGELFKVLEVSALRR
jgi:SAM-dependent MidA family methyltransferase